MWNSGVIDIGYFENGVDSTGNYIFVESDAEFGVGQIFFRDGNEENVGTKYYADGTEE